MSFFKGWPTLTEIFFGKTKDKKVTPKAMSKAKASPRSTATPKPRGTNKDLNLQKSLKKARSETSKKPTKKELSKLTKIQLEELGRQKGIELDRRLTKAKLVNQVHKKL